MAFSYSRDSDRRASHEVHGKSALSHDLLRCLDSRFAVTLLGGFAGPAKKSAFQEITVERINIVEPDGTLRMVLSGKSRIPGLIVKGKDGKVESWGHLSFDQYNQDRGLSIDAGEEDGHRRSSIAIWDRGDYPITDALEALSRIQELPQAQQEAEWNKFGAAHPGDIQRAYLGRVGDRSAGLRLMDQDGHDRFASESIRMDRR